MRTEILVVRHAEVHNPQDIVYGRLPRFGLSAHGREQAERTSRFLAGRRLDALYSSPLLRARQTAAIIARRQPGVCVHTAAALSEVRTGFQGRPNSIFVPGFSFYEPLAAPADETMEHVRSRMLGLLHRAVRRHAGGRVALVSHADPIAILRLALEGRELTVSALHATVYPARASVTQVLLWPDRGPWLSYFDVAGEGPT